MLFKTFLSVTTVAGRFSRFLSADVRRRAHVQPCWDATALAKARCCNLSADCSNPIHGTSAVDGFHPAAAERGFSVQADAHPGRTEPAEYPTPPFCLTHRCLLPRLFSRNVRKSLRSTRNRSVTKSPRHVHGPAQKRLHRLRARLQSTVPATRRTDQRSGHPVENNPTQPAWRPTPTRNAPS